MDDFCCFCLLISPDDFFYDTCGNNLKLRNHSRELITGPRACLHARCFLATSSPCSRCTPNVLPSSVVFSSKKEEPAVSLSSSLDLSITLSITTTFAESIKAYASAFRVDCDDDDEQCRTALFILFSCCYCCGRIAASFSSNKRDRRFRPPTRRQRYRSSSLVYFPILSCRNFPSDTMILLDVCAGFLSPLFLALSIFFRPWLLVRGKRRRTTIRRRRAAKRRDYWIA